MQDRNENIIRKIQGLLALANNNANEEEAQSAFLMAQKLMFKNDISMDEVEVNENKQNIERGQVTVHKKLYWWEKHLANVMGENFRVKSFINWRKIKGTKNRKKAICFMGYERDVKLAKEMYLLAYEAITNLSSKYVEKYYEENNLMRLKRNTLLIKDSYMRGFLDGLERKFEEQVEKMRAEENALIVLVPKEVEEKYNKEISAGKPFIIPSIQENNAYAKGYEDGNKIDYTRSTIDEISV